MAWTSALRILFIIYCVEAGVFLLLAPWTPSWDRTMIQLPLDTLSRLGLSPITRGAVSGFGLVHLMWGLHDLELWLTGRREALRRIRGEEPAGEDV